VHKIQYSKKKPTVMCDNKIKYDKLVRDGIPAKLRAQGLDFDMGYPNESNTDYYIAAKVREEMDELLQAANPEDRLKEFADLMVALDLFRDRHGIKEADVQRAKQKSLQEKGAFSKMVILKWVEDNGYEASKKNS
jgi:predicted house-cleaning noncanonical NTP pyrophosphatase (MazG superfamily)